MDTIKNDNHVDSIAVIEDRGQHSLAIRHDINVIYTYIHTYLGLKRSARFLFLRKPSVHSAHGRAVNSFCVRFATKILSSAFSDCATSFVGENGYFTTNKLPVSPRGVRQFNCKNKCGGVTFREKKFGLFSRLFLTA